MYCIQERVFKLAVKGFCGLPPWADPDIRAAIWRIPSLAVTHLELLAESELDLTSENLSPACNP